MTDKELYEFIRSNMGQADILGQLAEEAAELCQAALKLERVLRGTNPTPVTKNEATAKVCEETADVLNALAAARIWPDLESIKVIQGEKLQRWADRIMARKSAMPVCGICGEEMYETIAAGQRWWVCNSCGNWEEYE